ncbi:MAG: hypothetical protein NT171_03410 [Planctomycetota bacterium]|nr:hypothetical protein [Planctomycetota bacterium]
MGYFAFFLLLSAASLLWSAACTAAAARSDRPRLRSLLLVVGLALPVLALLPWLWASGWLAFDARMRPNWFGALLTVVLSALIGGIWISRAGLTTIASSAVAVASRWPVIGLFAFAILAKAVSFGTLLILDNAVAAEARAMRVEAAAVMQAALPPAVADTENAAILHAQAAAALAAAPDLTAADGPLGQTDPDVASPAVGALLARHAGLLDTIRRAADMPACRFPRDWTRPSFDMLLAEVQSCRNEGRLLALAARHEAATGKPAAALTDAVRLGRIGRQVGSEPILISHLVGIAIDATALSVVAEILPTLTPADAPLLDDPALRDLVASTPSLVRAINGEEAFGLSIFANFADGRQSIDDMGRLAGDPNVAILPQEEPFSLLIDPLSAVWRAFILPADIAGYRRRFEAYRQLVTEGVDQSRTWPQTQKQIDGIEAEIRAGPDGFLSRLIAPATDAVLRSQCMAVARHRAAEVLLAATRERLASGTHPASIDALVPARLPSVPRDPFTNDAPLHLKATPEELLIWSVGPDGDDDGGPQKDSEECDTGNDDIGLRMTVGAPATP